MSRMTDEVNYCEDCDTYFVTKCECRYADLAEKIATAILTVHSPAPNGIECTRAQMMLQKPGQSIESNMGGRNKQSLIDAIQKVLEQNQELLKQ